MLNREIEVKTNGNFTMGSAAKPAAVGRIVGEAGGPNGYYCRWK